MAKRKKFFTWKITPTVAFPPLARALADSMEADVLKLADDIAPEITAWMQANRKWHDQTGDARRTLHTEVNHMAHRAVDILLSHGVDYGWLYLELLYAGKYAIIAPAVDHWGPIVFQRVNALFSRRP